MEAHAADRDVIGPRQAALLRGGEQTIAVDHEHVDRAEPVTPPIPVGYEGDGGVVELQAVAAVVDVDRDVEDPAPRGGDLARRVAASGARGTRLPARMSPRRPEERA